MSNAHIDPHSAIEETDASGPREVVGMHPTSKSGQVADPGRNIHRVVVEDDRVPEGGNLKIFDCGKGPSQSNYIEPTFGSHKQYLSLFFSCPIAWSGNVPRNRGEDHRGLCVKDPVVVREISCRDLGGVAFARLGPAPCGMEIREALRLSAGLLVFLAKEFMLDELGSKSPVTLVEPVDQATDHSGDDFELFFESENGGALDEPAPAADFQ